VNPASVAPAVAGAPAAVARRSASPSPLLDAPILATLRLTAPSLVLALFQTAVSIGDTYFVAAFPRAWVGIFSADPAVLTTGSLYLRIVAPTYVLFAAGLALYLASQSAGHILLPMVAGTARLLVVVLGGMIVVALAAPLGWLFGVIALGLTTLGTLTTLAVRRTSWQR